MSRIFRSVTLRGIDAQAIEVEARKQSNIPGLRLVGLPDAACRESGERVRAAMAAAELGSLPGLVIVSLAPADVRKEGSGFDLAICLAVLSEIGALRLAESVADLRGALFFAELTLAGALRPVRGVIAAAELARREGRVLVIPRCLASLAQLVPGVRVVAVDTLIELVSILRGLLEPRPLPAASEVTHGVGAAHEDEDFADLRGQAAATRAALICAAGGHGLLLQGPPGCGKSMIARRLPGILPPLDDEELLEVARIRSMMIALLGLPGRRRPFRAPHHTTSAPRLVGGGSPPRPGEVSLAHRGVLFLDELPEFGRDVIDALREPLEMGISVVSRVKGSAVFPCRFQLVAAMNPCPCGFHGDSLGRCLCNEHAVRRYAGRVSGPVRDRIDVTVRLEPVPSRAFVESSPPISSAELASSVIEARAVQADRFRARSPDRPPLNAVMRPVEIEKYCQLETSGSRQLSRAMDRFGLTARGRSRALSVARTIADLAGAREISATHIVEALGYRT